MIYDLVIIGEGPAGLAAAVYACRKNLRTLVLGKENPPYIGALSNLSFFGMHDLRAEFQNELKLNGQTLEYKSAAEVVSLEKNVVSFSATLKDGSVYYSRSVILASGQNQEDGQANSGFEMLSLKDSSGKIKIDPLMRTNVAGLFAAGGVTSSFSKDLFISAGEGAKAAVSAWQFLNKK